MTVAVVVAVVVALALAAVVAWGVWFTGGGPDASHPRHRRE